MTWVSFFIAIRSASDRRRKGRRRELHEEESGMGAKHLRGSLRLALVTGAIAVASLLAGCGSDSSSGGSSKAAGGTPVVRVPFTAGFGTLPVHVADVNGYFKRQGLDVKLTEGLQLPAYIAALDRQYDITMATPSGFLDAVNKGLDLIAVSHVQASDPDHPNQVLVTKAPIKSLSELKGRRIGVPTLTGSSAQGLLYLLEQAGLSAKDVKLTQVEYPNMPDQLKAGRLDAVVSATPFYSGLEAAGYSVGSDVVIDAVKAASGGASDQGIAAIFVATRRYADANPDVIRKWRAALTQADEWIAGHEPEARKLVQSWLKVPPAVAESAPLPAFKVDITAQNLQPFTTISEKVAGATKLPDAATLVWKDPK
jgi:NitT/TauT family transport system substrate-binding protein